MHGHDIPLTQDLVLIGGGHAHMMTMAGIDRFVEMGHRVTVIGPSDHHYYSGMGPGMLGGTYSPDDIRFATRRLVEKLGGRFVRDKAERIDPDRRKVVLGSGDEIAYDVLSCNAGSQVPRTNVATSTDAIFSVKPIERLSLAKARIQELVGKGHVSVGIVGGGPSSAEIAGNVWQLVKAHGGQRPGITIFARSAFMQRFPQGVRRKVIASLGRRGIEILENERGILEFLDGFQMTLEDLTKKVKIRILSQSRSQSRKPHEGQSPCVSLKLMKKLLCHC
ncbi:MAG: FAD-dependent oxidoreductase [Sulfitobacter sp.]|nr:FAD-dependent oxidoreductase [Sulfitobacter sp.]